MVLTTETAIYPSEGLTNSDLSVKRYITSITGDGIKVFDNTNQSNYIQIGATETTIWRNNKRFVSVSNNGLEFYDINNNLLASYSGIETALYKPGTDVKAITLSNTGDAQFIGVIEASGGSIAGWNIAGNRLEKDNTSSGGTRCGIQNMTGSNGHAVFYAGCSTASGDSIWDESKTNFFVTNNGYLYCNNAKISGNITAKTLATGTKTSATSGNGFYVDSSGNIYVGNGSTNNFIVSNTGAVTAANITATGGKIGKYIITSSYLYTGTGSTQAGIGGDQAFWAGSNTSNSAPFRVSYGGVLNATGATISGTLTAGAGSTIGPWTISAAAIYRSSATYGASGGMYFGTSGLSVGSTFKVSSAGALTATGVSISGAITATSGSFTGTVNASSGSFTGTITTSNITATGGKVGGFNLYSSLLQTDGGGYRAGLQSYYSGAAAAFYAGCTTATGQTVASADASAFYVTHNGFLYTRDIRLGYSANGYINYTKFTSDSNVQKSYFAPSANNKVNLGSLSYRWDYIYSSNPLNTSDRKEKDNIVDINKAKDFILGLRPVNYYEKNGNHMRQHMGFIAQEVAEVCKNLNLNLSVVVAGYNGVDGQSYRGENVDDKYLNWCLAYNEFIAPIVAVIQEQQQEINQLKQQILQLQGGN